MLVYSIDDPKATTLRIVEKLRINGITRHAHLLEHYLHRVNKT